MDRSNPRLPSLSDILKNVNGMRTTNNMTFMKAPDG